MRVMAIVCLLVLFVQTSRAEEKKLIETNSIRLYLPDDKLRQRIGDDVDPLVNYIKALQKETAAFWEKADQPKAKGLLIAVGVKPDGKVKVWCDAVDGDIPTDLLSKLEKRLDEVPAVAVKRGPIAFAIELRLWQQQPVKFPEMPKAWIEAAQGSKEPLLVPDELFKVVWPD
jgi:hypothetical protein